MPKQDAMTLSTGSTPKPSARAGERRTKRPLGSEIEVERGMAKTTATRPRKCLLGLFEGARVPLARDFAEVRRRLWGSLHTQRARRAA